MMFRAISFYAVICCWPALSAPASQFISSFSLTNSTGVWFVNTRAAVSNVMTSPHAAPPVRTDANGFASFFGANRAIERIASGGTIRDVVSSLEPSPLDFAPNTNWVDVQLLIDAPYSELRPLGQPMAYRMTVTNVGPADATGVALTHPLPVELANIATTPSQGTCSITNGIMRWQIGTIAAQSGASLSVGAIPMVEGGTTITASVSTVEFDYNWMNNSGSAWMPLGVADLGVSIQCPPDTELQAGTPFQLSVLVTNLGPDSSSGVTLFNTGYDDFVPVGYFLSQGQVVEFREGGIPWQVNLGTIPASGIARLTLTLIPKQSGSLPFYSSVNGGIPEPADGQPDFTSVSLLVGEGQGIIEFSNAPSNVMENSGQAVFDVSRHDGSSGTVGVSYSTQDGTAIAGRDYVPTTGSLTFYPGETSKTISVRIIDNTHPDCNHHFSIYLTNAIGGAFLYGATNLTLTIIDDDIVPAGELKAVSLATDGLNAGGGILPAMSADGRWLVFMALTNLVPEDTNGVSDVYLKDLQTGRIQLVSVNTNGGNSAGDSSFPAISADGRWVVFATHAMDIVTNSIPSGTTQTVVRDLEKGVTQLVSVTADGAGADGISAPAYYLLGHATSAADSISSNGQSILFYHEGHDLIPGNTNEHIAYFVRDLAAQTTRLVTVNSNGTGAFTGDQYPESALSANGRRVVIRTTARDVVAGFDPGPGNSQVYVRDLASEATIPVSVRYADGKLGTRGARGEKISSDGRYIAFSDIGNDITPDDDNPYEDVFVRDVETSTTYRASAGLYRPCNTPSISGNGRYVAFSRGISTGPDPIYGGYGYPPNDSQIYACDCWSNALQLASADCFGDGPGNRHARNPVISSDGRYVVFQSFATDLAPGVFDDAFVSLFRRDLIGGETVLVSLNRSLTGGPVIPAWDGGLNDIGFSYPALSTDGSVIGFMSTADDLVWGDDNGLPDVFAWREGYSQAAVPTLGIERNAQNVLVKWPNDATNFILQSTTDLNGAAWIDVLVTGTNGLYLPQPNGRAFYRLKAPTSP